MSDFLLFEQAFEHYKKQLENISSDIIESKEENVESPKVIYTDAIAHLCLPSHVFASIGFHNTLIGSCLLSQQGLGQHGTQIWRYAMLKGRVLLMAKGMLPRSESMSMAMGRLVNRQGATATCSIPPAL